MGIEHNGGKMMEYKLSPSNKSFLAFLDIRPIAISEMINKTA